MGELKLLRNATGVVMIKSHIPGQKKEEFTKKVFDIEQYINNEVAIEVYKRFGLAFRLHIQ